ncbi:SLAIN motif-containing protein 2-like isoform X2 [Dreissena polymorpha]|uniref:SLAIN motif-containing protein 2-like isoform X2 n=1 Tax=Dreissena polymorpha TaxID=45954 RepID=UPI00226558FF|nr:SLAIN motif-containing protein 2-like isoform X2 [Dreissena polymorpha]
MTSILEIGEGGIDPQAEVRKLQDLVKKLETQNEVLRQKQKLATKSDTNVIENDGEVLKPTVNNSVFYNSRKHSDKRDVSINKSESLETVELIDLSNSDNDAEDSWLYSSPRPLTPQQHRMSPYKWIRQDLDNPSPEVHSARKALKFKLDEVARMSRSSSTPVLQDFTTAPTQPPTMSLSADSATSPRIMKPSSKPSMVYNSSLQGGNRINTGTFTRPKKSPSSDKPSPEAVENGLEHVEMVTHHQNVADIENLAKQQEESLRQSIAQSSPRRGFRSRPLPNMGSSQGNDTNSVSSADSNRSSPVRLEDNEGRRDSSNSVGSDHSSPSDSPYGSSQHLNVQNAGHSNFRGSAPNMSRLIPRVQHHNSESSLADFTSNENEEQYEEEPTRYVRVPPSQMARPASPSVSGLKQPQRLSRGGSPQRSGLPTPRRSIPRPASTPRSSIASPSPKRISGLPAPQTRVSQQKPRYDDNWRDGCF